MTEKLVGVQDGRRGRAPTELGSLTAGQLLSVGGCDSCRLDLRLDEVCPFHIEIRVLHSHWLLGNLSATVQIVAEDLEDPLQRVLVPPSRHQVPIPFELTRIRADGAPILIVSGHEPVDGSAATCRSLPRARLRIDVSRDYFRAGVLLCAERLVNGPDAPLMSTAEIARRLSTAGHTVAPRNVRSYLDYLADKLNIPQRHGDALTTRGWRRELLARTAIATGVIGRDHLDTEE